MNVRDVAENDAVVGLQEPSGADLLRPLVDEQALRQPASVTAGVLIGKLVGIADGGRIPLVTYPGQPGTAALQAQTVVDLHGPHVGRRLVLMLEGGDPLRPVIMGVLREAGGWSLDDASRGMDVNVDGESLIVSAKERVVLRCGTASITLTKSGKVLIQGSYVVTHSSGVNRIKGGSVQIN